MEHFLTRQSTVENDNGGYECGSVCSEGDRKVLGNSSQAGLFHMIEQPILDFWN